MELLEAAYLRTTLGPDPRRMVLPRPALQRVIVANAMDVGNAAPLPEKKKLTTICGRARRKVISFFFSRGVRVFDVGKR